MQAITLSCNLGANLLKPLAPLKTPAVQAMKFRICEGTLSLVPDTDSEDEARIVDDSTFLARKPGRLTECLYRQRASEDKADPTLPQALVKSASLALDRTRIDPAGNGPEYLRSTFVLKPAYRANMRSLELLGNLRQNVAPVNPPTARAAGARAIAIASEKAEP